LLGIGASNGFSVDARNHLRFGIESLEEAEEIAASCYWTFCGSECTQGYTAETQARGIIPGLGYDAECPVGLAKTLCCAPSTTIGKCQWDGWRGVGMPCTGSCEKSTAKSIAENTNSYRDNEGTPFVDHTCNGGTQQYCCEGFKPPAHSNLEDLVLLGRDRRSPTSSTERQLTKRKVPLRAMRDAQCHQMEGTRAVLAALGGVTGVDLLNDGGLSAEIDLQMDACEAKAAASETEGATSGSEAGSSESSSGSAGSVDLGEPPVDLVDNPTPEGFDGISTGQTSHSGPAGRQTRSGAVLGGGVIKSKTCENTSAPQLFAIDYFQGRSMQKCHSVERTPCYVGY
jgi:hypothetical protein